MKTRFTVPRALLTMAALLAITCTPALFSQTETGQITGTIFDQTGGIITNATVTVTDPSTRFARTVTTSNGIYVFPSLLPGRYEVTAAAPSFQTVKQTVTVTIGSKIGLDFHLTVGTQTQIVEVAEQVTQVNIE